jgi:hypothetical protein
MSISYSSITTPYVKTKNERRIGGMNKSQVVPYGQHERSVFLTTYRTLNSTFPSTLFAQAQKVSSLIPKVDFVKHMLLKVDVAVAAAPVGLVPANYFFREIALRDSTSGKVIQMQYDDVAHANMLNRCSAGRERSLFRTNNIEFSAAGKYGLAKQLPIGVHTFYIPLLTSVFENFGGLYLNDMEGDLVLDLTTPSTIIATGAGTISATVSFMVEGAVLSDKDVFDYKDRYRLHAAECNFLMPVRTEFPNKTLTAASSNNTLVLNNVDGLCAYQMMMVRPTGTIGNNAGFATWKMLNIGDSNNAGIDLDELRCVSMGKWFVCTLSIHSSAYVH